MRMHFISPVLGFEHFEARNKTFISPSYPNKSSRYLHGVQATLPTSCFINYFKCFSNKSDFIAFFVTETNCSVDFVLFAQMEIWNIALVY